MNSFLQTTSFRRPFVGRILRPALFALLALSAAVQAAPSTAAPRATVRAAVLPTATVLSIFDATGLPAGAAKVVAVRVTVPAGTHFTHLHGGNVYNFMISGELQSIDDGVTHAYHAGQFFWEPLGHIHTVVSASGATFFGLQILTPHATPVLPVQGETTPIPPATVLSIFDATGIPTGPAKVVAARVLVPAGTNFKHVHGGNGYNFMLSGELQSIDDGVTHTYKAGQFFWEPVGHVHTVIGIKDTVFYSILFLTPNATPTQPVR